MFKCSLGLMKFNKVKKYFRKNYCRVGVHKLTSGSTTFNCYTKKERHIKYLDCEFCDYRFFANESERRAYNKHDQRFVSALTNFSSSGKPKHYNAVGEKSGRDVSVSAQQKNKNGKQKRKIGKKKA